MADKRTERQHPFDQMMFGPRVNHQQADQSTETDSKDENYNNDENSNEFNIFNTAQTMMDTYKQLSPYVKGVSSMLKKYKS